MSRRTQEYIDVRINQLKEDLIKCRDSFDQAWYNRLIQELDWVKQMQNGKATHNCYMEPGVGQQLDISKGQLELEANGKSYCRW